MVGNYSSYLEFIGAVYFSMSLDEIFKKKIWSPRDEKKQKRVIEDLGDFKDKNFAKAVVDANKVKVEILQAELCKKSVIGMFIVACLLLFCGYEATIEATDKKLLLNHHCILFYIVTAFVLSIYYFHGLILRKWEHAILYIFLIQLSLAILLLFDWLYDATQIKIVVADYIRLNFNKLHRYITFYISPLRSIFNEYITKYIGIYVCIIITLPIITQLLVVWIFKHVFYEFIKNRIIEAKNRFHMVMIDINNGNYEKLPQEYKDIYIKNSHKDLNKTVREAYDDSLTVYQGVLYNEIRRIGNNVKIRNLLIAYKEICYKKYFNCNSTTKINIKDYEYYAIKYQKYKSINNKMKEFCNKYKINHEEFSKYYCKFCQQNNFKHKKQ